MDGKRPTMLVGETIAVALSAVRANALRSFLTMLGIIIGIGAVITMVALGEGAQRTVQDQINALGTNVLTVRSGRSMFGGVDRGSSRITMDDAEALRFAGGNIAAVSPEMESHYQVVYGRQNANLSVMGVWPEYFDIQNHHLADGAFFTPGEEMGRRRVAVVGSGVAGRITPDSTAMLTGLTIQIRGIPFDVVGVLASKGEQGFMSPDETIFIPASTASYRVFGNDRLRSILVQTPTAAAMDPAMGEIDRIVRRLHRTRPGEDSPITVRNQTSLLETAQDTTRTFTYLLAGIAMISLLVGGIGIMNIMLVSVTERTREIGVRKALGARRRDIMLQFLVEALVLCLAGGALGIAAGYGGAAALSRIMDFQAAVAIDAVVLALGFSGAVGLFFGLWPARRAALLDPIVSLRYE